MGIISLITAIWMITLSLLLSTKDMISTIIFKVIPFFIGIANLIMGLKLLGWIS
jgi:uncharacterized protein YebE (UPF0316 family)